MNGLDHISDAFRTACDEGRAALMPYFTLGFPTPDVSLAVIEALAQSGADLIELGVPFSDPLADGPTIQHSTQTALEQGMTVRGCLDMVARARARGVHQPLVLMGYINPLLAYGVERYTRDAAAAGADGLIIPDLPVEEGQPLEEACRANGLALIYMVSPNAAPERVAELAARTSGFLYLVSLTGVTGARENLAAGLADFTARVRAVAHTPLAVGFGIATPQQAQTVAGFADGVIIGSALIQAAGSSPDPASAAAQYTAGIKAGLQAVAQPRR